MAVWRLRDPSSLHWRQWEDGLVVFHAPSGDTHLVDPSAGAALLLLRDGARDISEIAEGRADLAGRLEGFLVELLELGVVERA